MFTIKKSADSRDSLAILHKIADIPGGISVKSSILGGSVLYAGTPLSKASSGLYEAIKTAVVQNSYVGGATTIKVNKGHHFVAGDSLCNAEKNDNATIVSIDKSNSGYDVLTISSNAFVSNKAAGDILIQCTITTDATVTHDGVAHGAFATETVTEIKVDKGHSFVVGDIIAGTGADPMTGKTILDIDRSSSELYDTLTLSAQIGKAIADDEALICVTEVSGTTEKTFTVSTISVETAIAIVGQNYSVETDSNLFINAWLQAVVNENVAPKVPDFVKAQLTGITYISQ